MSATQDIVLVHASGLIAQRFVSAAMRILEMQPKESGVVKIGCEGVLGMNRASAALIDRVPDLQGQPCNVLRIPQVFGRHSAARLGCAAIHQRDRRNNRQ